MFNRFKIRCLIFRDYTYVIQHVCKENSKTCRSVIGLDGHFLKGLYEGQILTSMWRDTNDQTLKIVFTVVEGEKGHMDMVLGTFK